ncbi:MAG: glycosyl hydrolase family 18 protein [Lachnospiraceae bacterium]|nr:glycosyl hydrolase family 18 protein [Lachnospiraceae bacterium]
MRTGLKTILLLLVSMLILSGCSVYESVIATDEKADLNEFFGVSDGEAAVFVDDEQCEDYAVVRGETYYLPMDLVRSELDKRFYWDGLDDRLLFTDAEKIHEESVSDSSMALMEGDQVYLSTACLEKYLDIQISVYQEPDRIFIDKAGQEIQQVSVAEDTQVRVLGGFKSAVLTEVLPDSRVRVLTEHSKWAKVRTEDGFVGYMLMKYLNQDEKETVEIESVKEEPEYTSIRRDEPICLAWHDMENSSGNRQLDALTADTQGINVISPAWFALTDNEGSYRNLASADYVRKAHEKGMEVWVLIDDFNENMSIGQVLGKNSVRQKLVDRMISDVKEVNADGINVDFEYITDSCGVDFIQFLRELSIRCREEGLVLSVDNANPTFVKYCYDMAEQGRLADYVILMGYDEHWQGSEAGSVASLPYVENGIKAALEMVPAEKIISGLPFYTRVWTEIPEQYAASGAEIRQDGNSEYERYSLDSVAVSMDEVDKLVKKAGVSPEWDESIGQYYVEIPLEHGKQRIWIEDVRSLEAKLDVVSGYSVAGVAFWRIGMDNDEVWDSISAYLKKQ